MKWNRNDKPPLTHRIGKLRPDQPGEKRSKRDAAAILQGQHKLSGSIVVKRTCGNSIMTWRFGEARSADRAELNVRPQWPVATDAGRCTGYRQFSPAPGAKANLRRQTFAAQGAARREQQIGNRIDERVKLHGCGCYRLHQTTMQGRAHEVNQPALPTIFAQTRRLNARRRAQLLQARPGAARYLLDDMTEDMLERLAFLRHEPRRALVVGDWTGALAAALRERNVAVDTVEPAAGFAEESPFPSTGYDLIASMGTLDTVNDLPGALIHIRNALAPGGLALASFSGAGSLPMLRAAMLEADGDRPAPRLHPAVDVRAGGQLLQRAGWANPVVDSRTLDVRFSNLASLVADLRAQGLTNSLMRPGPPLGKAALVRAAAAFGTGTIEHFEILTLSGWRPRSGFGESL